MWQEAASVLEDGLKTYPSFITAMVALGRAYDQMNQPVKSKAILEEAVKLSPENLRAHRTLAKIYVAQGAKEEALRSCNVILAVNPQDQEALSFRAALGAPAAEAQAKPPKPPRTNQPGKPASDIAMPSIETVSLTTAAKSEPAANTTEEQAAPVTQLPQENPASTTPPGASMSEDHLSATATRLEQWLASIQARRQDRSRPTESNTPTS
jgi:tetratricopeptide (TPR) repeat protein